MMLDSLMKPTTSRSGLVCSVFRIFNVKYQDFVDVFGPPHNVDKENIHATWLYKMYDGVKVEVRYDRDDYTLYKLQKSKARSMTRVSFDEIDFLEVMMNPEDVPILISFLLSVFRGSHYEKRINNHDVIKKILDGIS